jgi:hypothetical protein
MATEISNTTPDSDGHQVDRIDSGQHPALDGGGHVVAQLASRHLQVGLLDQGADRRDVGPAEGQDLGIVEDEVHVGRDVAAEELLRGRRLGAAAAVAAHQLDAHLAHHGLEDLGFVLEIVVEGPGGEVGTPHDVAHARRAIAHLGKHGACGLQQCRTIFRLFCSRRPDRSLPVRAAVML